MKKTMTLLLALAATTAFANTDLEIAGERWEAKHTGYTCAAFAGESNSPLSHEKINAKFEVIRTDKSLDNALILATFEEGNSVCRYSSILIADNAASTIKLVKSRAYALNGNSKCLNGKNILDSNLANNEYLYWGHPHHVTIMMPVKDAETTCGPEATHVGLDFTVSRFLGER